MVQFLKDCRCSIKISCFLAGVFLLFGCYRTVCPAYADEYLNWIPYKLGDSVFFTDSNDTLRLCVEEEYKPGPFTQATWLYEIECVANIHVYLSGNEGSPTISGQSFYNPGTDQDIYYSYSISFNGETFFHFQGQNNNLTTGYNYVPANILLSYYNGFKEYFNVLKLEIDTLSPYSSAIYQVYFAESAGIIEFSEKKDHKTWSLIEK